MVSPKQSHKDVEHNTELNTTIHVEFASNDNADDTLQRSDTCPSVTITRSSWWDNKKIISVSCFINLAGFEYGLDQGTVNGFQAMPGFLKVFGYADPHLRGGYGITTTVQQLITSLVAVGMLFACLFAGPTMSRIGGRRQGLALGCLLCIISTTVQISSTKIAGLYIGRLLLGLGNGYLLMGSFLYMQEVVPANLRSLNYTLYIFWVNLGNLVGSVINNSTSKRADESSYRIPLGTLYIIVVILPIGLYFLPESPRFLVVNGRKEHAYKALRWLRDSSFADLQVEEELAEITHAIRVDFEVGKSVSYIELFRSHNIKRTLISFGLYLFVGASGSQFIIQYGIYFFTQAGDTNPFRSGVILVCLGLAGGLTTPLFTGRIGKRQILIFGSIFQALCMLGMAVAYTVRGLDTVGANTILAMSFIFMFLFASTIAPFSAQVSAEIPSQPLRAHTLGIASALTYLSGWLLTFTVPYFINPTSLNWGAKYGYIWVPSNLLMAIFTFFCVPETNKRTLEEIDECFIQGISVRKFSSYDAVGSRKAREDVLLSHRKREAT